MTWYAPGDTRLVGAINTRWPAGLCFVRERRAIATPADLVGLKLGDQDGHAVELYFQMEQVGWDGRPRPAAERRPVDEGSWPETLDADEREDSSEPFLGPLG